MKDANITCIECEARDQKGDDGLCRSQSLFEIPRLQVGATYQCNFNATNEKILAQFFLSSFKHQPIPPFEQVLCLQKLSVRVNAAKH